MVEHLRRQKNKNVNTVASTQAWPATTAINKSIDTLNSILAWPAPTAKNKPVVASSSTQAWPAPTANNKPVVASSSTQAWPAPTSNNKPVDASSSTQAWPAASRGPVTPESSTIHTKSSTNVIAGSSSSFGHNKTASSNGFATSSYASLAQGKPSLPNEQFSTSGSSRSSGSSSSRITHSTSAPNLVEDRSLDTSESNFPPVPAVMQPVNVQAVLHVQDVQTANKSLVERICAGLAFDQDKYIAFKDISGEFRQGLMDASTYLIYVQQFGLTHLVLELAKLCPDEKRQRELIDTFNANFATSSNRGENGGMYLKGDNGDKRGKGKSRGAADSNSKDKLADDVISTVRKLQSNFKPSEDEVELLSKDGYRAAKGKSKVEVNEPRAAVRLNDQLIPQAENSPQSSSGNYNPTSGAGDVKSKQNKKTSKFHRARLGDGSMAALLDLKNSGAYPDPDPDSVEAALDGDKNSSEGLPVCGVWHNGGGSKLLSKNSIVPKS